MITLLKKKTDGTFTAMALQAIASFLGLAQWARILKETESGNYTAPDIVTNFVRTLNSIGSKEHSADVEALTAKLTAEGKTPEQIAERLKTVKRTTANGKSAVAILQRLHGATVGGRKPIGISERLRTQFLRGMKSAVGFEDNVDDTEFQTVFDALSNVLTQAVDSSVTVAELQLSDEGIITNYVNAINEVKTVKTTATEQKRVATATAK